MSVITNVCSGFEIVKFLQMVMKYFLSIHSVMMSVLIIQGKGFILETFKSKRLHFLKNSKKAKCDSNSVRKRYRIFSQEHFDLLTANHPRVLKNKQSVVNFIWNQLLMSRKNKQLIALALPHLIAVRNHKTEKFKRIV